MWGIDFAKWRKLQISKPSKKTKIGLAPSFKKGEKKLEIEKAKAKTKKHPGAEDILGILALCI